MPKDTSKVDFTKPLIYGGLPIHFVGLSICGRPVLQRPDALTPFIMPDRGLNVLKNAPVTHTRWIVIVQFQNGDISSFTMPRKPLPGDHMAKVLAVKEVTIEEGEGL